MDIFTIKKLSKSQYDSNDELADQVEKYNEAFKNKLDHFSIIVNSDRGTTALVNNEKEVRVVVNLNKSISKNDLYPTMDKVDFKPTELNCGDLLKIKSRYSENFNEYLLSGINETEKGYCIGFMELCNNILTIDRKKKYPCVLTSNTMYTDGINKTEYMDLFDGKIKIRTQLNKDTNNIKVGEKFIFNNSNKYRATHIFKDPAINIITIMMSEIETNHNEDNMQNNIINEKTIKTIKFTLKNNYNVNLNEKLKLNIGLELNEKSYEIGDFLQHIKFEIENNEIINIDDELFIVAKKKGATKVKIIFDDGEITHIDNFNVTVFENLQVINLVADIKTDEDGFIMDNYFEKEFKVVFRNNNEKLNISAKWKIINTKDGELVEIIKEQNDLCIVKSIDRHRVGTFILLVESMDGLIKTQKEIVVKKVK